MLTVDVHTKPSEPRPDIDQVIVQLRGELDEDYSPPHVKRHAHPKMHGCVQAVFRVDDDVPEDLREGVFRQPGREYRAWVRFSNAFGIQPDLRFENRGMAIKLLDVEDVDGAGWLRPPGLEEDPEAYLRWETGTQDFVLSTGDVFVLPDTRHYSYGEFAGAARGSGLALIRLFVRKRLFRGLIALIKGGTVLPRNLLALEYFSQTPYQLGSTLKVKLQARPRMTRTLERSLPGRLRFALKCMLVTALTGPTGPLGWLLRPLGLADPKASGEAFCHRFLAPRNYARLTLSAFLARSDAQFEIMVQRQVNPDAQPEDDATVPWSRRLSPFRRVAVLTIPKQVFWPAPDQPPALQNAAIALMTRGENMSFSPWHGLTDHAPLGDINDARGRIYASLAKFRREERNHVPIPRPEQDYDRLRAILQDGFLEVNSEQ